MSLALSVFSFGQLSGTPGAFTRMGFGARGMGMGNAMVAVRSGELTGFYNPAVALSQRHRIVSMSYGFLSLDRSHNALSYTQPIDSNAAVSFGVLNAGVGNIDGRDVDGYPTEYYSTSENMFSLSFALKIRSITLGISTKIFYYRLFEEVSSSTLGIDFGALYPLTDQITIAAAYRDVNSKYKWETTDLYGQLGNSTTEDFPARKIAGISYAFSRNAGVISLEYEIAASVSVLRVGGEYTPVDAITFRAGVDGWNLDDAQQAHPSFGLTVRPGIELWNPSLTYAYIVEPYRLFAIHVISLSVSP
ncbi:MAG: PorV/PorQ family protein [Bacteroidota bacterium]